MHIPRFSIQKPQSTKVWTSFPVQKRVNLAEKAWDCFSLGRLARLALGRCQYLDFERIPTPRMRLIVPKLYPKMWLMLNSCFPSGNLEFSYVVGRRCLHDQPRHWVSMSFPARRHFIHMCCHKRWRNEVSPVWLPLGEAQARENKPEFSLAVV